MPWKLRQRANDEILHKKVYVCPETSCVHHNPSRALGDLTGVKKHFCRKHGEKKWKCERCSKKYAAKCDLKVHMKSCGTREYKCDCGTVFSRRDNFVTHRRFCDGMVNESGRGGSNSNNNNSVVVVSTSSSSPATPPLTPSTISSVVVSPTLSSTQCSENPTRLSPSSNASTSTSCCSSFSSLMSSLPHSDIPTSFSIAEPTTLSLFTPLYLSNNNSNDHPFPHYNTASPQPVLSATALLQKAAQVGSSSSNASLLRALGLKDNSVSINSTTTDQWNSHGHVKQENEPVADYLGLGLPCGNELRGSSNQPMTRDLLGLSMGLGREDDDLSALLTSFGGNLD